MRDAEVVGIVRAVIARRERVVMLEPFERGLLGTVLRYGYEVRDSSAYFEDIPNVELPDEIKDLALLFINRKAGHFDPSESKDRYEDAVAKMVRTKQGGTTVTSAAPASPGHVINLMEALRKSIGQSAARPVRNPTRRRATTTLSFPQNHPLRPIRRAQRTQRKRRNEADQNHLLEQDEPCQRSPCRRPRPGGQDYGVAELPRVRQPRP